MGPQKTNKQLENNLMAELDTLKKQVEKFLTDTEVARFLSERDRDYVDHKQWTDEEVAKLQARGQAPIVVNRVRPKVAGLKGLYSIRKTDPKAYPRTKKHEEAAHAATDALRFVADNNDFDDTRLEVADNVFTEGYGGAITDVRQRGKDIEIRVEEIPWDRIFFDPHSRKRDFSDARYMGMILWMDKQEIKEKFPKVSDEMLSAIEGDLNSTFEDRPRWTNNKEKRMRVAMHFYIEDAVWKMAIYTGMGFLIEPADSPFLNDIGEPSNPIELVSAYIDRDNNRYGEVRGFIDQQDEINHRRSKGLHLLSQRQTFGRKGEVGDVDAIKNELAKPDGHIEFNGETFGKDFGILPTNDMAAGQFELYQDAKAELDAVSFNAQLSGERQQGDLSGRAIDKLQQAGTIELNDLFSALAGWEKRIYRQIWSRVKQFWNEEKWIRVTDDQDNLRWVGLNGQITTQEFLEEKINDESTPLTQRKKFAAVFQMLMGALEGDDLQAAELAEQKLNEPIGVRNDTSELDVDIILDQSFDAVNVQQEQFQMLVQFAQGSDIDVIELIELSQLRGKEELIEKIEQRRAQAAQAAGNIAEIEAQDKKAKMAETMSKVQINTQEAITKQIENVLLVNNPPEQVTQVSV